MVVPGHQNGNGALEVAVAAVSDTAQPGDDRHPRRHGDVVDVGEGGKDGSRIAHEVGDRRLPELGHEAGDGRTAGAQFDDPLVQREQPHDIVGPPQHQPLAAEGGHLTVDVAGLPESVDRAVEECDRLHWEAGADIEPGGQQRDRTVAALSRQLAVPTPEVGRRESGQRGGGVTDHIERVVPRARLGEEVDGVVQPPGAAMDRGGGPPRIVSFVRRQQRTQRRGPQRVRRGGLLLAIRIFVEFQSSPAAMSGCDPLGSVYDHAGLCFNPHPPQ